MKTNLEGFSEKVAATALELSVDSLKNENKGFDPATILVVIELIGQIITMVQKCKEKKLVAAVVSPTWLEKIQFRMVARNVFSDHPEVKVQKLVGKVTNAFFVESNKLTKEQVEQIVEETDMVNNWLI